MMLFGGIDLPVFEIIFVLSILLVIGLVLVLVGLFYVIKEIKNLSKLLTEEEADIKEFEQDLAKLEQIENESDKHKEVVSFIKSSLDKGYPWDHVKSALQEQGYDPEYLEEVYNQVTS